MSPPPPAGEVGRNEREGAMDQSTTQQHARELRERQTKAESLLWNALRAKRLSGVKFRRQHPIPPFVADFACVKAGLVVEIDGGYHDYQFQNDEARTSYIERKGFRVIRFSNEDVVSSTESVVISIANDLGIEPVFGQRKRIRSGMMAPRKSK